jgi:DNA-directed RNA polymerase specialized sigma24 family protein
MPPDASSENPSEPNKPLSTRSSMIVGLKELSQERWQDFILVYSPLLRFWIRRKSSGNQAEDDILQDCLRTIFTGLPQFERGSTCGTFRGWLRVIVQRLINDHFGGRQVCQR